MLLKLANWEKRQAIRCTESKWKIANTLGLARKTG
jgi:hypothetical protein